MEAKTSLPTITCPLHPSEPIQRINSEVNDSQRLFCLKCILQQKDASLFSALQTIPDFIEMAADFYVQNKKALKPTEARPQEYLNLLSAQTANIEQLSHHIEEEKKKVTNFFDAFSQEIARTISAEKLKYLHHLDQQLLNLRDWYVFLEKQVKKAYPSDEDMSSLYPTKEDLEKKLAGIGDPGQLETFVRGLNGDMKETQFGLKANEDVKSLLQVLKKELNTLENSKPCFVQQVKKISGFKEQIKKQIKEFFENTLVLDDPVKDLLKDLPSLLETNEDFKGSMVTKEEFQMIKEWIPNGQRFKPKLLYRASRDGSDGEPFMKACNGKRNTVTLVKARFHDAETACVIGGYLDEEWHSENNYIASEKAFLFSLNLKAKIPIRSAQYAAYGSVSSGRRFGAGPDLYIPLLGQGFIDPYSYLGTNGLVNVENYKEEGRLYFQMIDVEVYSLD